MLKLGKPLLFFLLLSAVPRPAPAQVQRFKVGGGGGLGWARDLELDFGRAGTAASFIGIRFNDSVSLEGGFWFSRTTRLFTASGQRFDETTIPEEDILQIVRTDYSLETSLVVNLGRRAPLHPFLLVGAGAIRRETQRTTEATPEIPAVITQAVENLKSAHFGAGLDIYFLHNVSARVEARLHFPEFKNELRILRLVFGGTFYF
jgi:hypothetical protein